jgi:hypothetical protein
VRGNRGEHRRGFSAGSFRENTILMVPSPVNNIFHRQWPPGRQGQALYPPFFPPPFAKLFDNQEVVQ